MNIWNLVLFKIILPLALFSAAILRFNSFSGAYLFFFLLILPIGNKYRRVLFCLCSILTISILFLISQIAMQITIIFYNKLLSNCTIPRVTLIHQIGIMNLHKSKFIPIIRIIIPDVWVLIICILCIITIKKRRKDKFNYMANKINRVVKGNKKEKSEKSEKFHDKLWNSWLYQRIKIIVNLFLSGCVGIISPSVLNLTYLLLFLIVCTLWACGFYFTSSKFYYIRVFLLTYSGMHIILLYLCQFQFFQIIFPDVHLINRLLGLYYSVDTSCSLNGDNIWKSQRIIDYINPFLLAIFYYIYSLDTKIWIDKNTLSNLASVQFSSRLIITSNSDSHNYSGEGNEEMIGKGVKRPLLSSMINAFIRNSYILTFIAMMAWSVTYMSWLTFMFLLLASILWLMPDSRKACLYLSPVIVGYGIILIILDYITNINAPEIYALISKSLYGDLNELGMFRWDLPLISLSITIGYLVIFWLTLRLFSKERKKFTTVLHQNPHITKVKDDLLFAKFVYFIQSTAAKYWIFVCCIILLTMSVQAKVKACYIIYVILMTYFVVLFMFRYTLWRKQMYTFWWIVVLYSLTLLFGIYTYQFNIFRQIWHNYTIITSTMFEDFGFETYSSTNIFEGLIIPVVFLVVTIFQVDYVHKPFLKLSDIKKRRQSSHVSEDYLKDFQLYKSSSINSTISHSFFISTLILLLTKWKKVDSTQDNFVVELNYFVSDVNSAFNTLSHKLTKLFNNIYLKLWRLFEVHFTKIVVICIICYSVYDINAFNGILVLFVIFLYPFQNLHGLLVSTSYLLLSVQLISRMIYQLSFINIQWKSNCSHLTDNTGTPYPSNMDNMKSIGLEKYNNFREVSKFSILNLILCSIWYVIKYHQIQHFTCTNARPPDKGIIFQDFLSTNLSESPMGFLKFILNFAFYRIGLELCFIMTVINAYIRSDVMSVVYLSMLMVFLPCSRLFCSKLWILYLLILTLLIPIQYFLCFGFFPMVCDEYPQVFLQIKKWVFYPHTLDKSNGYKLIGDMFQLLFVISQHHVFLIEKSSANYKGGDNRPILVNEIPSSKEKDFISHNGSYLDYLKVIIYYWFYWICLAMLFINGFMRNTVFCFGYMILATIYFWIGQKIMLKKRKYLLSMWNVILFYNFFVIMVKSILQLVGCIIVKRFMTHFHCWIFYVVGIQCFENFFIESNKTTINIGPTCKNTPDRMRWDVICFALLILQRKIFQSKLFCFVVLHLKIQNKFASRGAQLISKKLMTILRNEKHKEDLVFGKIQQKILRIEQTHQNYGKPLPNEHYLVLRSGDYFLFDGNPEDEDNEYANQEYDTSTETPFESLNENQINVSTINPIILKPSEETYFKHSKLMNKRSKESDELKKSSSHKRMNKNQINNQHNLNNENLKLKRKFVVINPQRVSTYSDDSYYTPMSKADDVKFLKSENSYLRKNGEIINYKTDSSYLRRNEESDNYRITILPKLRKKISISNIMDVPSTENGCWSKIKLICRACYNFFIRCLTKFIKIINQFTQNSRTVSQILDNEKKIIKRKIIIFAEGNWLEKQSNQFFVLTSEGQTLGIDFTMEAYLTTTADIFKRSYRVVELLNINVEIFENTEVFETNYNNTSKVNAEFVINEGNMNQRSKIFSLIIAFSNLMMIYSEVLCYIILIFNHMISFSIISLVYPLIVFLWAMLSVPRPSTVFWMFIILYTQMVILTKYIFQFNLVDFTVGSNAVDRSSAYFLPVIIGIDEAKQYAMLDLIQLLVLFLHRGYLKDNGLWISFKEISSREMNTEAEISKSKRCTIMLVIFWPWTQLKSFYINLIIYRYSKRVDFYVYMFICEFMSFFIIALGYSTFGFSTGRSTSALDFIKENKIPVQFILMVITQFIFIIIDRALFLRKQVTGKLIFLIFHVILIHGWIFLLNPYLSQSKFNEYIAPQLLYFTKCLYFALSAYQIKSGYPLRILGNFLTKKYNYVNLFLFKAYMIVPFLYELRNVMDWIWTDTSVSLYHWMEVEDVFTKIFVIKCWRRAEIEYPTHRGVNRWVVSKVLVGGILMSFFFICLWGPLTVGTIIGATFVRNPPIMCTSTLEIDGFAYLYQYTSRNQNLKILESKIFEKIQSCYKNNLNRLHYFKKFEAKDITVLELALHSQRTWFISPPNLKDFNDALTNNESKPKLNFIVACERLPKDLMNTIAAVSATYTRDLTKEERSNLSDVILRKTKYVQLLNIIPKFIVAQKRAMQYIPDVVYLDDDRFLSIKLSLDSNQQSMWWSMEAISPSNCTTQLGTKMLTQYLLSERISDSLFGQLFARYGILGMYAAYILVAHRVMRAIYADISYIIRCEELPYVDRILAILNEIYLVRENKMFRLEEQLVAKLIFIYRSSETMIKWTRHKQSTLQEHMD